MTFFSYFKFFSPFWGAVSEWRVPARVNDAPAVGACRQRSPAGCRLMDCVNADVGSTCGRPQSVRVCGYVFIIQWVPSVGIQIIQAPNHSASESGAPQSLSQSVSLRVRTEQGTVCLARSGGAPPAYVPEDRLSLMGAKSLGTFSRPSRHRTSKLLFGAERRFRLRFGVCRGVLF